MNTNRELNIENSKPIEKLLTNLRRNRTKYKNISNLVTAAIDDKKVFALHGQCPVIKDSLLQRNWLQKLTVDQINRLKQSLNADGDINSALELILISEMLQDTLPNLLWISIPNRPTKIYHDDQFINRIMMDDYKFTSKSGLCKSAENRKWCTVKGLSKMNIPRSYILDREDLDEFEHDYKITACTNLLKWFISKHPNQTEENTDGWIHIDVIHFAMEKCMSFIKNKAHYDIDDSDDFELGNWTMFLKNFHILIHGDKQLNMENINYIHYKIDIYKILNRIKKHNPYYYCDGILNMWIIKPANGSLGKGIMIKSDLNEIVKNITITAYPNVIQKYIEVPLLIHETKFDIRQYYLITKTYPLTIWMYKNCYLRFSSKIYNLNSNHESIHLTNHAVQKNYKVDNDRNSGLPECNMWTLSQFKDYLKTIGYVNIWRDVIYPGMKQNIIGTMLCSQPGMIHKRNNFALYGCDFVLDERFQPWLIEINSRPDMTPTTPVTRDMCPEALRDSIKVILDHKNNRRAYTGNFERIFYQTITPSVTCKQNFDLAINGTKIAPKEKKRVRVKKPPRHIPPDVKPKKYRIKKNKPFK